MDSKLFRKLLLHLHTQFSRDIPWNSIDMDFMNLNQSAHGEGIWIYNESHVQKKGKWLQVTGRMKVVHDPINAWCRAAAGWHDLQQAKFVRFGDNMRQRV